LSGHENRLAKRRRTGAEGARQAWQPYRPRESLSLIRAILIANRLSHARSMRTCAKKFRRKNFALQRVERAARSRKNFERTARQ